MTDDNYTQVVEFIRENADFLHYNTVEALANDLNLNLPALLKGVRAGA